MKYEEKYNGRNLQWAWQASLACFVLAGLTGALYRFGIGHGLTLGFDLENIRHAHSHLMYFGWVTPALMATIATLLPRETGRPVSSGMQWILGAIFVASLIAYPLFLAFGYSPVEVGNKRLPLGAMSASLHILIWYAFVGYYGWTTRGVERNRTLLLWDLALTFLVLASFGAWGVGLLPVLGVHDPAWAAGLTHLFLDLFSEGWFVLGVLGLFYACLEPSDRERGTWSLWAISLGLPVTFALGMPASLVPVGLKTLASVGGTLVAVGLLANVRLLWGAIDKSQRWRWQIPLVLLAVKALAELAASLIPGLWWPDQIGLRVLYLHVMLLGFVTLGVVAAAEHLWERLVLQGGGWFYGTVLLVLCSLLPLTRLWPAAWGGRWTFVAAAWVALLPVLAAARMLVSSLQKRRAVRV